MFWCVCSCSWLVCERSGYIPLSTTCFWRYLSEPDALCVALTCMLIVVIRCLCSLASLLAGFAGQSSGMFVSIQSLWFNGIIFFIYFPLICQFGSLPVFNVWLLAKYASMIVSHVFLYPLALRLCCLWSVGATQAHSQVYSAVCQVSALFFAGIGDCPCHCSWSCLLW